MTKKLIILLILIVIAGCVYTDTEKDLRLKVAKLTEDVRVSREMLTILSCESDFRHDGVFGDNGKSYGIAQFKKKTFDYLKHKSGRDDLKWTSKKDQLWLLEWSIRENYARYWSCSTERKIVNK
jgi:hypothetical protein